MSPSQTREFYTITLSFYFHNSSIIDIEGLVSKYQSVIENAGSKQIKNF